MCAILGISAVYFVFYHRMVIGAFHVKAIKKQGEMYMTVLDFSEIHIGL